MRVKVDEDSTVVTYEDVRKLTWTSAHYLEVHHTNGDLTLVPHEAVGRVEVEQNG